MQCGFLPDVHTELDSYISAKNVATKIPKRHFLAWNFKVNLWTKNESLSELQCFLLVFASFIIHFSLPWCIFLYDIVHNRPFWGRVGHPGGSTTQGICEGEKWLQSHICDLFWKAGAAETIFTSISHARTRGLLQQQPPRLWGGCFWGY